MNRSMSYPAVEVKVWYNVEKENMEIGYNFIDTILKIIPNKYLDKKSTYPRPNPITLDKIQSSFDELINEEDVRQKALKLDPEENGGIKEFEIVVGMAYLNKYGSVEHVSQYENYKEATVSQREIRAKFA